MNKFIIMTTADKQTSLSIYVLLSLPVGMSAAGSWWEVRGAAGFERHGHLDTMGEYDYLQKGEETTGF